MNKPPDLSFNPREGGTPPFLSGRKDEKNEIKRKLDLLKNGKSPGRNVVLIGPRGNGKTVLLQWVKEEVGRCYEGKVECVRLLPHYFRTRDDLVELLTRDDLVESHKSPKGFEVKQVTITPPYMKVEASRREAKKAMLRDVLEQKCSESGFVILMDEAHTLNKYPDEVREFFTEVQTLASAGRPLLLILAGTPNISRRFAEIDISFWNRIKKFGIGLLNDAEAKEALRTPLKQMRYSIEDEVLDRAASEAQRYPYFLQIVGSKLHRAAELEPSKLGSGKEIGCAILEQALTEFGAERDNYYNDCYEKLRKKGMLDVAEAVASRFVLHKEGSITGAALEVTIKECIDGGELTNSDKTKLAAEFENNLRDYGFVWSDIGKERWCEPGIPSLMNYILKWKDDRDRELELIGKP